MKVLNGNRKITCKVGNDTIEIDDTYMSEEEMYAKLDKRC